MHYYYVLCVGSAVFSSLLRIRFFFRSFSCSDSVEKLIATFVDRLQKSVGQASTEAEQNHQLSLQALLVGALAVCSVNRYSTHQTHQTRHQTHQTRHQTHHSDPSLRPLTHPPH